MAQKCNLESDLKKKKRESIRLLITQHFRECETALQSGDKGKIWNALIKLEDKKSRLDKLDSDLDSTLIHKLDQSEYNREMIEIERYHDHCVTLKHRLNERLQTTTLTNSWLSTVENFMDKDVLPPMQGGLSYCLKRKKNVNLTASSNPQKKNKSEVIVIDGIEEILISDDDDDNVDVVGNKEAGPIQLKEFGAKDVVAEKIVIKTEVDQPSTSRNHSNGNVRMESSTQKESSPYPSLTVNRDTEELPDSTRKAMNEVFNNDELLFKIINNLDICERIKVERVCKRWRKVSLDTWSEISSITILKSFEVKTFELRNLEEVLRRGGKYLIHLDCSHLSRWDRKTKLRPIGTCKIISQYCDKLRSLRLEYSWWSGEYVNLLNDNIIKNLTSLSVGNDGECYTDRSLYKVVKKAVNLEKLSVVGYDYFSNVLRDLSQKCTTLSVIRNRKFTDEMLLKLLETHPNIRNLNVSDSDIMLHSIIPFRDQFTALGLSKTERLFTQFVFQNELRFPNLKVLDLSYNGEYLDEAKLLAIINYCPMVEDLRLREAKFLHTSFRYLENLKNLMYLDVSFTKITGSYLVHLARKKRLKQVFCEGCKNVFNSELNMLVEASPELSYLVISSSLISNFSSILTSLQMRKTNVPLIISLRSDEVEKIADEIKKLDIESGPNYRKTNILKIVYGLKDECTCDFYKPCCCYKFEDPIIVL